jgi:probable rRNA maturation factor
MATDRKPRVSIVSTQKSMRVPRTEILELVELLAHMEDAQLAEVDIAVVDDEQMANFHAEFLGSPEPTDVLSFDLSDDTVQGVAAQIVVSAETAARQGPLHGLSPRRELLLYVTHGLLHMLGYNDHGIRPAARMHAREDEILAELTRRQRQRRRRSTKS